MSTPYNLSRYNLSGFNVTPSNNIYAHAESTDYFGFIAASTTGNVFPQAKMYETIGLARAQLTPGRFAAASNTMTIDKLMAALIGCCWRELASSDVIDSAVAGNLYFWRKAESNDAFAIPSASLIGCCWREISTEDAINCDKAEINAYFWRYAESDDLLGIGSVHLSNEARPTAVSNDEINGLFYPSQIAFTDGLSESEINGNLHLSSTVFQQAEMFDLIDALCSAVNLDKKVCTLTVTLRPGQVMIIDSNIYNVWIDQENAVYVHSGDWLDELNRETQDFVITAASGKLTNIEASILYTERYL